MAYQIYFSALLLLVNLPDALPNLFQLFRYHRFHQQMFRGTGRYAIHNQRLHASSSAATLTWLEEVGKILGQLPDVKMCARLRLKAQNTASLKMYAMMMGRKKTPQAAVIGEYDLVKGLSAFLRSVGIDVKYKLCSHSLKSIVEPELDIQYISIFSFSTDIY